MANKKFDIIIFGATSFVGQIMTKYFAENMKDFSPISWAIAGRSQEKLDTLRSSLGEAFQNLPMIVCDAFDPIKLDELTKSSRVVASTVGPYALYGEELVKACAQNGTDYCDLCGEAYWIKDMIQKYNNDAIRSGARIVNCCGFDSIPSDLGVLVLQEYSKNKFNSYFPQIKLGVAKMKGGASGGTLASMIQAVIAAKSNPALRKEMANPYILCPEFTRDKIKQNRVTSVVFDDDFKMWSAPFIMEAINTRVVMRSHFINEKKYGAEFLYQEQMLMGKGVKGYIRATSLLIGLGIFALSVFITPTRKILQKFILPKPGQGPSVEAQRDGYFDINLIGISESTETLCLKVTGDTDPGYGCTAKMLAHSALSLAFDAPQKNSDGGFLTPSSALGTALVERLKKYAGMTFEVIK